MPFGRDIIFTIVEKLVLFGISWDYQLWSRESCQISLSKLSNFPFQIFLSKVSKFPFTKCQNFPFQTVKYPFPNCQNFPFQTVKIFLSKLSKFSFPNSQNFCFRTVKILLSKLSKFFFQTVKISLFQTENFKWMNWKIKASDPQKSPSALTGFDSVGQKADFWTIAFLIAC